VSRGEHIRQGSDIVHGERALPAVATRIPRGRRLDQRHTRPVETGETTGRCDHRLRACLSGSKRRPTATGGRGFGPVRVHRRPAEVRHQVRGIHANREHGRHQPGQPRRRGVHQRRR